MTVDSGVAARALTEVVAILLSAFAAVLAGIAGADGDLCYTWNIRVHLHDTNGAGECQKTTLPVQTTLYNTVRLGAVC